MVTSNKLPEKKIVKMEGPNGSVVPQRILLSEVNQHLTCPLCRGYYIDATTIVECLHSFCRSCIIKHLQVKSYCPVCEMMINSAKPNIKVDKALQDIVYKLVPGLFQKEMERRQLFYSSRPGPAASATPEQRGEDTERIIFSPEDVISFSLEYSDLTDNESISSKSSDSNEAPLVTARRYLQCPAVVNISHLKKFLSMKFDIDTTQFAIDILYKRVPLPDYYTLMDIAYIYNWKRNEPMRFIYQIIDYVAIRNRLFDRKDFQDRKSSPATTEDTNVSSPAPNLNDQASEASSGIDSPMPEDNGKSTNDNVKKCDNAIHQSDENVKENSNTSKENTLPLKKKDDDEEKSQFLISFELTAKSNTVNKSPSKPTTSESESSMPNPNNPQNKIQSTFKVEEKVIDNLKRKHQPPSNAPELKKLKIELEKAKMPTHLTSNSSLPSIKTLERSLDKKEATANVQKVPLTQTVKSPIVATEDKSKQQHTGNTKSLSTDSPGIKRTIAASLNNLTSKRKPNEVSPSMQQFIGPKIVSPIKLQIPKLENQSSINKTPEIKPPPKKMPDLKPSVPMSQLSQNKGQPKVRMDLLANNSDPTIDRSKILSQVKTSLTTPNVGQTGDQLKSLFDSCKINIPSSLSITLTEQKLDPRNNAPEPANNDPKKVVNKNLAVASNSISHKVPSPPVRNSIEILKISETEPKKQVKQEGAPETKQNPPNKGETSAQSKPPNKSSEGSAKGPIPNLNPISDTKLAKQSGNYHGPITFQQSFEQQVQNMQSDKKAKPVKNKAQVPKLVPATPKSLNAVNKSVNPLNKPNATESKGSTILDLSSPHNLPVQQSQQQAYDKALETMHSIANLAKKQNTPSKGQSLTMSQSNTFSGVPNRTMTSASPLRMPPISNIDQMKLDKVGHSTNTRQELSNKPNSTKQTNNTGSPISSTAYQASVASPSTTQPSPRQTRSPSSSPKLVIAEEKQSMTSMDQIINQSNQITSTQIANMNIPKNESPKASPGPSKPAPKPLKSVTPVAGRLTGIRQPITPNFRPTWLTHQALLKQQMEMNAWLKAQGQYAQYDFNLLKNMTSMSHQNQNDFNNKDKQ